MRRAAEASPCVRADATHAVDACRGIRGRRRHQRSDTTAYRIGSPFIHHQTHRRAGVTERLLNTRSTVKLGRNRISCGDPVNNAIMRRRFDGHFDCGLGGESNRSIRRTPGVAQWLPRCRWSYCRRRFYADQHRLRSLPSTRNPVSHAGKLLDGSPGPPSAGWAQAQRMVHDHHARHRGGLFGHPGDLWESYPNLFTTLQQKSLKTS